MDGNQFDRITKWMSTRRTRRESMRAVVGGAIGAVAVVSGSESALAAKPVKSDYCPSDAPKLCDLTCTNTISDSNNCGGCGVSAPVARHARTEVASVRAADRLWWRLLDTCVTDPANCGSCGHTCSASECLPGSVQPAHVMTVSRMATRPISIAPAESARHAQEERLAA